MAKVELTETLDFPGNSNTTAIAKTDQIHEKPKPKKVTKGKVVTKKPSFGKRAADLFLGDESVEDVKGYILLDVIVPAIKDLISDVIVGGLDMILFGEHRARGSRRSNNSVYTSYSNISRNDNRRQPQRSAPRRAGYMLKEIIFDSRGAAEEVLGNMIDYLKDYGTVSVGDLYDMVGEPGQFTDNAWGWYDLGQASVRRVRDGYTLVLPRIESIK